MTPIPMSLFQVILLTFQIANAVETVASTILIGLVLSFFGWMTTNFVVASVKMLFRRNLQ